MAARAAETFGVVHKARHHKPLGLQVVEWIVEMPHPSTLANDTEREALHSESTDLLRLTPPAGATATSELQSASTELLAGSIWVTSSAGGSSVALSNDMDISAATTALGSLQGVTHLQVERTGRSRSGFEYTVTFTPDKYAAGEVPMLAVENNDMTGAAVVSAHTVLLAAFINDCALA